jgi:signal transduction histidine kinase
LAHALGLERSELRLRTVTEQLRVGVLIENFETGLRAANPAALTLLGLSQHTWRDHGSNIAWDDVLDEHEHPLPHERHPLTLARAERRSIFNSVVGLKHAATDPRRWLMFHIDVERAPAGSLRELTCIVHDITDRRVLEQRLRHSQRMEAVGSLAAGVAHDFNNVLTAVGGCAQLAEERLTAGSAAGPYLREIFNAATRAGTLTRKLLLFSTMESVKPSVLDVNQAIESSLRLLRRLLRENIALELLTTADLPRVRFDPGELEQVIVNLVVNARDAMPHGGTITIQTERCREDSPAESNTRRVVIKVSDTGVGMDENTRARAFDPFFTTKPGGVGVGLGLASVYGIVRQSGGEVALRAHSDAAPS